MNIRRKIIATAAAITIAASTALTGATQPATDTSSVTVGGGDFTVSLSASDFGNVGYSLENQTAEGGSIILNVGDLRGNAAGWSVTLSITDFEGQTVTDESIPVQGLEVDGESIRVTKARTGSQEIAPEMRTPVYVEGPENQLTWSAPEGQGQGAYNLYIEAGLIIPGGTLAQTYTATGTVNIDSAP